MMVSSVVGSKDPPPATDGVSLVEKSEADDSNILQVIICKIIYLCNSIFPFDIKTPIFAHPQFNMPKHLERFVAHSKVPIPAINETISIDQSITKDKRIHSFRQPFVYLQYATVLKITSSMPLGASAYFKITHRTVDSPIELESAPSYHWKTSESSEYLIYTPWLHQQTSYEFGDIPSNNIDIQVMEYNYGESSQQPHHLFIEIAYINVKFAGLTLPPEEIKPPTPGPDPPPRDEPLSDVFIAQSGETFATFDDIKNEVRISKYWTIGLRAVNSVAKILFPSYHALIEPAASMILNVFGIKLLKDGRAVPAEGEIISLEVGQEQVCQISEVDGYAAISHSANGNESKYILIDGDDNEDDDFKPLKFPKSDESPSVCGRVMSRTSDKFQNSFLNFLMKKTPDPSKVSYSRMIRSQEGISYIQEYPYITPVVGKDLNPFTLSTNGHYYYNVGLYNGGEPSGLRPLVLAVPEKFTESFDAMKKYLNSEYNKNPMIFYTLEPTGSDSYYTIYEFTVDNGITSQVFVILTSDHLGDDEVKFPVNQLCYTLCTVNHNFDRVEPFNFCKPYYGHQDYMPLMVSGKKNDNTPHTFYGGTIKVDVNNYSPYTHYSFIKSKVTTSELKFRQ